MTCETKDKCIRSDPDKPWQETDLVMIMKMKVPGNTTAIKNTWSGNFAQEVMRMMIMMMMIMMLMTWWWLENDCDANDNNHRNFHTCTIIPTRVRNQTQGRAKAHHNYTHNWKCRAQNNTPCISRQQVEISHNSNCFAQFQNIATTAIASPSSKQFPLDVNATRGCPSCERIQAST